MARTERQPWLDQRDGVFYVFWYDKPSGRVKRISLRTRDSQKARISFAAFLTEGNLFADGPAGSPADEITCGMALDVYWREHTCKKVVDQQRDRRAIDYLNEHWSAVPIKEANADVALPDGRIVTRSEHYCERRKAGEIGGALRKRESSAPTWRRELSVFVAALNYMVATKRAPAESVPFIPLPDQSPPREYWLRREELTALLDAARTLHGPGEDTARLSRVHRFTLLSYYTASRRAAIERLTWFQVDTKGWATISLSRPGEKRTSKRRPVVPISPALLPDLKRMHAERVNEYVLDAPSEVYRHFCKAVRLAGLEHVPPHGLRHTRATHLLQDGVNPWQVAGLLGDRLETVLRVYGHHCPNHLGEIRDADLRETR